MENILQEYRDEATNLKYQISCLELENNTLDIQMKELQKRANEELEKKDKTIAELDEELHRVSMISDSELKKLQKDKADNYRNSELLQQQLTKLRNEYKRTQTDLVEQLCSALGLKVTAQHTLSFLLTKIRQLKQQYDAVLFDNQKLQKQSEATTQSEKRLLKERVTELEDEVDLLKMNQQHDENKYRQQITHLEKELKGLKTANQKLQGENDRTREELKREKEQYLTEIDEFAGRFENIENEKNQLRQQLEGMSSENRGVELEHEFGQLLDKIRVKKQSRIKSLLSEKYWRLDNNAKSMVSRDASMLTHQYS